MGCKLACQPWGPGFKPELQTWQKLSTASDSGAHSVDTAVNEHWVLAWWKARWWGKDWQLPHLFDVMNAEPVQLECRFLGGHWTYGAASNFFFRSEWIWNFVHVKLWIYFVTSVVIHKELDQYICMIQLIYVKSFTENAKFQPYFHHLSYFTHHANYFTNSII